MFVTHGAINLSNFILLALRPKVDNTVRENKNRTMLMYCAWLVGRLDMRLVGLCQLRKGHTHDVLGALACVTSELLLFQSVATCSTVFSHKYGSRLAARLWRRPALRLDSALDEARVQA